MNERAGLMSEDRLALHKADCRAAGGRLSVPCEEGLLTLAGPVNGWTYKLDGAELSEDRVLTLSQTDFSY